MKFFFTYIHLNLFCCHPLTNIYMRMTLHVIFSLVNSTYYNFTCDYVNHENIASGVHLAKYISIQISSIFYRRGGDIYIKAVADESTSHIQALVNKQRSKKVKVSFVLKIVKYLKLFGLRVGIVYTVRYDKMVCQM